VVNEVTIYVQWRTVLAEERQAYYFPQKFTRFMRKTYAISAVYRWRVLHVPGGEPKAPIYIGEGEDLLRRMQRVLTPPKEGKRGNTNRRLHDIFAKYVAEGRTIVIEVADVEPFEVNGIPFGRETIADKFKRRALENMLLVIAQKTQKEWDLLNVFIDPVEKVTQELSKLLKRSPSVVREVLKRYKDATSSE
jgi:hypothetical protein